MSTTKVTIDGQDFDVKLWTVRERRTNLKKLAAVQIADATKVTESEADAIQEAAISFLMEQLGKTRDEIEGLAAVTSDKLISEIIKANRAPLG